MGTGSSCCSCKGPRIPDEDTQDGASGPDPGDSAQHLAPVMGAGPGRQGPKHWDTTLSSPPPAPVRAHTYFAGAGDRRAVDAQAAHAGGRRVGGQRAAVVVAALPGDDAAAVLGSGFLPAPPASHRARDQWAARAGGAGPARHRPARWRPLPFPLGDQARRGTRPTQGRPFCSCPARPFRPFPDLELSVPGEELGGRTGPGEGLAEAAFPTAHRFGASNFPSTRAAVSRRRCPK